MIIGLCVFFFQAEDGIRDLVRSRGLGDVYKRQGRVLWPASTPAQQRTNLRQLLFMLRRRLPAIEECLTWDEQTIGWRSDAAYTHDVADFQQALQQAGASTGSARVVALEDAVMRYAGDLLPGRYEDWILAARERPGQHYVGGLALYHNLRLRRGI